MQEAAAGASGSWIARSAGFIRSNRFSLSLAVALCFIYLFFFGYRGLVTIEAELKSPYASYLKIYWAAPGDTYIERNMRQVRLRPGKTHYRVFLTDIGAAERLRIDPLEYAGKLNLKRFTIDQLGFEPVKLGPVGGYAGLQGAQQVETSAGPGGTLDITTTGRDSQMELVLAPVAVRGFRLVHLANVLLIFFSVMALRSAATALMERQRFVPGALLLILVMASAMAALTDVKVHPDELVHLEAVSYYSDHFLPPRVDDPAIANSYSGYGYSRLANLEIYYVAAGYLARLLEPLQLTDLTDARLFGLLLLAILVLLALGSPAFRIFTLPMLVSAQTWYLFSYANSDGLALFVAIVASYQAAASGSLLNRFLKEPRLNRPFLHLLLLGGLVGVMLLSKTNFYFFILFLGAYLLWRIAAGDFPDQRRLWARLLCIGLVGASIYGARVALDHNINGPDPSGLRAAMIEKYSDPLYRPSTPLPKQHIYLYMKDRGWSLDRILNKEQWFGKTYLNAFGSYGFTQYFGSTMYFEVIRYLGLALLGVLLAGALVHGPPRSHVLFGLVIACSVMLVAMLLWRSWTISFQAQGRYLAPILPMLGVLYYHLRQHVSEKLVMTLLIGLFLCGVYSFVFIGLHDIPKIDYFSHAHRYN